MASEPTTLNSIRVDLGEIGSARMQVVRLSIPHVTVVGAQAPSTNRLKELIVGAYIGRT